MVNFCAVVGCSNRWDRDQTSFHRLPKVLLNQGEETEGLSSRRRHVWLSRLARADLKESSLQYVRVCSRHFISGHPAPLYSVTDPDWAPSLHLGHDTATNASSPSQSHKRCTKRRRKIPSKQNPFAEDPSAPVEDPSEEPAENQSAEAQTEPMAGDLHDLLPLDCVCFQKEPDNMNEECFHGDDAKVKFYTGLPTFSDLMSVYESVCPHLSFNSRTALSKFQQLILCLLRLKLNLSIPDLSYRFNISTSAASKIFANVINVLYHRLNKLVKWPTSEEIEATMPTCYRTHFGTKVSCIIDCFEIFVDRPSTSTEQTFSSCRHHNTVKFLIGITPRGVISFISKAWGGRVSDKYLTENSGFLDNILPGDLVLAHRGFDSSETVGMKCATVKIPAFVKGRKQLSMSDVLNTREMAAVRMHVERVTGLARQKYAIMNASVPMDYVVNPDENNLTLIDKIVHTSCSLTNLSPLNVPMD